MPSTLLSRQQANLPAVTDFWDRQLRAQCRHTGSATFFGPDNETAGQRIRRENDAKKICRACPARPYCLTHALHTPEPHGVWGGTAERERAGTQNPTTARATPLAS